MPKWEGKHFAGRKEQREDVKGKEENTEKAKKLRERRKSNAVTEITVKFLKINKTK